MIEALARIMDVVFQVVRDVLAGLEHPHRLMVVIENFETVNILWVCS